MRSVITCWLLLRTVYFQTERKLGGSSGAKITFNMNNSYTIKLMSTRENKLWFKYDKHSSVLLPVGIVIACFADSECTPMTMSHSSLAIVNFSVWNLQNCIQGVRLRTNKSHNGGDIRFQLLKHSLAYLKHRKTRCSDSRFKICRAN